MFGRKNVLDEERIILAKLSSEATVWCAKRRKMKGYRYVNTPAWMYVNEKVLWKESLVVGWLL